MSLVKNIGIGPSYFVPIIKEICKFPYMSYYRKKELGTITHDIFMKYVESDDFQTIVSEAVSKAKGVWRVWNDTFIYFEDGIFLIRTQYNMAGLQLKYAFLKDVQSEKDYYNNYHPIHQSDQYTFHNMFFRKGTTHKIITRKLLEDYRNKIKNGVVI